MESIINSIIVNLKNCTTEHDILNITNLYDNDCLLSLLEKANEIYHTDGECIMTDYQYDILYDKMKETNSNHHLFNSVGSNISPHTKDKCTLPIFMGSMNKIKEDKQIHNWIQKYSSNHYILSAKLDGISALFDTKTYGINNPRLYTRGNGTIGRDISYLIPFLKIPQACFKYELRIRGELIMKKSIFDKYYSKTCSNSRNLVAGIVNQKYVDYSISNERNRYYDIDFVSYNIYYPTNMNFIKQVETMKKLRVKLPYIIEYVSCLWVGDLNNILKQLKDSYDYMIDGVIVCESSEVYGEMYESNTRENPKWAFAYKNPEIVEIKQTVVEDVLWSASKDKYLKPKIKIREIVCDGSKIQYVTGFNAKYIQDNKIGPGSIIKVGLSGGVIPHVFEVINTSTMCCGKMPDKNITGDYQWNDTGIDIILLKETKEVLFKKTLIFLKSLDIDTIGEGTLKNIFIDDSITSITDILMLNEEQFVSYPKIGKKKAMLIMSSFRSKLPIGGLVEYMYGSQIFDRNFGTKRLHTILKDIGRQNGEFFKNMWNTSKIEENKNYMLDIIRNCNGISDKFALLFIEKTLIFNIWYLSLYINVKNKTSYNIPSLDELYIKYFDCHVNLSLLKSKKQINGNIVVTGLRISDSKFIDTINNLGLEINDGQINSKTKFVIKKNIDTSSSKIKKAIEKGIPILTLDEFTTKFIS